MLSSPRRLLALLVVPVLLLAASSARAQAPAAKKATRKTAAAEPLPPIFDPDALGTKAVEAATEVCNQSGRRMFVILGTNDCKACRVFNDVLYDHDFLYGEFLTQFIPVPIDVSPKGPNAAFVKNYAIDTKKGYPAVAIFEGPSVRPEITRNGEMVKVIGKGPDAIRDWIRARFKKTEEETPKK